MNKINNPERAVIEYLGNKITGFFNADARIVAVGTEVTETGIWAIYYLDIRSGLASRLTSAEVAKEFKSVMSPRKSEVDFAAGFLIVRVRLTKTSGLPEVVQFPGIGSLIRIGMNASGEEVTTSLRDFGHGLIGGMTGSGKSVFLRSLAFQAAQLGANLILVDGDMTTFNELSTSSMLLEPIGSFNNVVEILEKVVGMIDERAGLFSTAPGVVDIDSWNSYDPTRRLKRVLFIIDEYNAIASALGKEVYPLIEQVAWRGRKFGVHLVIAGQTFEKNVVGRVRDQLTTKIVFRVADRIASRIMLGSHGAEKLKTPGRAATNKWGLVQTYMISPAMVESISMEPTVFDRMVFERIRDEFGGSMTFNNLFALKLSRPEVESIREKFVERGWAKVLVGNKIMLNEIEI